MNESNVMKVLGVCGSPKDAGSVDKLVKSILNKFDVNDVEFIALNKMQVNPCIGCFGCVQTNKCVQKDDWLSIEDKILKADVLVLGVPTYYGAAFGINAMTHNFLERWFSLRHRGLKTNIKKVILAVVSGEEHGETAVSNLKTFFEVYHQIEVVDSIIVRGTTPCYVCGYGEECPLSAVLQRHGQGTKITKDMIQSIEKQNLLLQTIDSLPEKI